MNRKLRVILIIVAVVCFAGALTYPARVLFEKTSNEGELDKLRSLRKASLPQATAGTEPEETSAGETAGETLPDALAQAGEETRADEANVGHEAAGNGTGAAVPSPGETAGDDAGAMDAEPSNPTADANAAESDAASASDAAEAVNTSGAQARTDDTNDAENATESQGIVAAADDQPARGAVSYFDKPHLTLDESRILPQYRPLYDLNHDLVGWLLQEELGIDYPVMQTPGDNEYYLHRDFYGRPNSNGQLILDETCDAYTPSYNQIVYGHNMISGAMFGRLSEYRSEAFWRQHKLIAFDNLMEERVYVIVASFFGAQYEEGEPGFRYAVDFQDEVQYDDWMAQVVAARCYDTGVPCAFGDEFLTLSTCAYHVENGRFVVVARRLREGEVYENEPAPE